MFNFDLWKTSGHADHYKDDMFLLNVEKQEFGLKPMNCPGWQTLDDSAQTFVINDEASRIVDDMSASTLAGYTEPKIANLIVANTVMQGTA